MKTVKTDIISGFLGAGKTTLIKKLLADVFSKRGEKIVIIENEFGKVGIDGGFLRDAGVEITEMNSGCICCSLVGDFGKALKKVCDELDPDRIIIEPSGVGKLSDVAEAVVNANLPQLSVNCMTAVVDAKKCKMYLRNYEEFYKNQISSATAVVLSKTGTLDRNVIDEDVELIRAINPDASLVTTDWAELDGEALLSAMENVETAKKELEKLLEESEHEHHHHHHHHHDGEECDDPDCECHHHHDDDDDEDEHEHHHHHHHDGEECDDPDCECHHHHDDDDDDDDDDDEHEHHHHHHHHHDGEECDDPDCECHHHHHHHGHDADDVFSSVGFETGAKFEKNFIDACLDRLDSGDFGAVLRCKGILPCVDGSWIHFDYVPGDKDIRTGGADITGRLCVIGSGIDKAKLKELFNI